MTNRLVKAPDTHDAGTFAPVSQLSYRARSSKFVFSRAYHVPANSEWTCIECTYLNADSSNPTCSVCGTVNHFENINRSSSSLGSAASYDTPIPNHSMVEPGKLLISPTREKVENDMIPSKPRMTRKQSSRRMVDVAEEFSPSKPFLKKASRNVPDRSIECIVEDEDDISRRLKELEIQESACDVPDPPQNRRRESEPIVVAQRLGREFKPQCIDEPARVSSVIVNSSTDHWECGICTYVNENPLHLVCDVCGYARERKRSSAANLQQSQAQRSFEEEHILFEKQQREQHEAEEKKAVEQQRWQELLTYQREILEDLQKGQSSATSSDLTNRPATEYPLMNERET